MGKCVSKACPCRKKQGSPAIAIHKVHAWAGESAGAAAPVAACKEEDLIHIAVASSGNDTLVEADLVAEDVPPSPPLSPCSLKDVEDPFGNDSPSVIKLRSAASEGSPDIVDSLRSPSSSPMQGRADMFTRQESPSSPMPLSRQSSPSSPGRISALRPASVMSMRSAHSTLSWSSCSSSKRIIDWNRSADRNLCHIYRLCEEYLQLGYGQTCPDHTLGHVRGIDFTLGRKHIRPDLQKAQTVETQKRRTMCNDEVSQERAKQVLSETEFFRTMDTAAPGIITKLARKAEFRWEVANQIFFRQDDPAGHVYILTNGEVGYFVFKNVQGIARKVSPRPQGFDFIQTLTDKHRDDMEKSPGSPTSPFSPKRNSMVSRKDSIQSMGGQGRRGSQQRRGSNVGLKTKEPVEVRYTTSEGHSTFCTSSQIGEQVATKSVGDIFGKDGPGKRTYSAKCIGDCEVLVLKGADYKDAMHDIAAKSKFFDLHVPGCKAETNEENGFHASSLFLDGCYKEGHTFLTEGITSQPVIFVIKSGTVELCRYEDPLDDAATVYTRLPPKAAEKWSSQSRALMPFDCLSEGDIFCSLTAFPIQALEPLTAIAKTSDCEVYYCTGARFDRLPPNMLQVVRSHLMQCLVARLLRIRERVPEAFMPPMSQEAFEKKQTEERRTKPKKMLHGSRPSTSPASPGSTAASGKRHRMSRSDYEEALRNLQMEEYD